MSFSLTVILGGVAVTLLILKLLQRTPFIASVAGKHVLITGASSGIGYSFAKRVLEEGGFVTLVARNRKKLENARETLLEDVKCHSDKIQSKIADVGDYAAISKVIEEAFAWRPIDVLVCNAGFTRSGFLEDCSVEDLDTLVRTNILGTVYPTTVALPLMKQRSYSHPSSIVFLGSLASLYVLYGNGMYTGTKYAVRGVAEALRMELYPYNMRVNLVCPGFVESAFLDDVCKSKELQEAVEVVSKYNRKHAQSADEVASIVLAGIKQGTFLITTTPIVGPFLAMLCRGMTPDESFLRAVLEALVSFPVRVAMPFVQWDSYRRLIGIHRKHNPRR